jgi:hypothetical protein
LISTAGLFCGVEAEVEAPALAVPLMAAGRDAAAVAAGGEADEPQPATSSAEAAVARRMRRVVMTESPRSGQVSA